ncbi:hypothetical protein [Microbacterium luteum]|uniref:hypothetical protein n=1 Tax=Microbacterium luteum TaxID=2782167 RepID=UPI001888BB60|nr:hypothetical protein [Microbacterium luteum]
MRGLESFGGGTERGSSPAPLACGSKRASWVVFSVAAFLALLVYSIVWLRRRRRGSGPQQRRS